MTKAAGGALIVAPEDAVVVGINRGWSEGSKVAYLRTNSGLFLVLGGFAANSQKEFGVVEGAAVRQGDKLGRILGTYGMLHFETYSNPDRKSHSQWKVNSPPPDDLLNPTNYVERMIGDFVTLATPTQRHEALAKLGFYAGNVGAPWGDESEAALKNAQAFLGLAADGKWGPKTETAIRSALFNADDGEGAGEGAVEGEVEAEVEAEAEAGVEAEEKIGARVPWAPIVVLGSLAVAGVVYGVLQLVPRR